MEQRLSRSCGDDCVDKLVEKATNLHNVTHVLNGRGGFTFVKGSVTVKIDESTTEGKECIYKIHEALKEYKQAKLDHLGALALGKIDEVNHADNSRPKGGG